MNLGIDLGTTFSLAAYLNRQGVPTLVPDARQPGVFRTPSVVHVDGSLARVGQALEDLLLEDPGLPAARGFKPLMGLPDAAHRDAQGRAWPAEALSALMLRKLLQDLEAHASEAVEHCVITVPANFSDTQRRATRLAAQLAGLQGVQLIEEPIAAAAFYGFNQRGAEQTLLVFDFGGGTFDVTVLQISGGRIFVLAIDGDSTLGGRHIDQALVHMLAADLKQLHGIDALADAAAAQTLRRFAETAKIGLLQPGHGSMRKALVLAGRLCELTLARDQVEGTVAPVVERALQACRRCLDGAGLGWRQVDRILLVGGSSLMPQVAHALQQDSGKPAAALVCRHPHQAVAYGAALLAEAGDAQDPLHPLAGQAVAPFHLGLRVRDPASGAARIEVLIKRNTPLPARCSTTLYTTRADQNRMVFDIVQSKGEAEAENSLGHFVFGPLRHPRRNYPVELTLAYDAEGLVRVSAHDSLTGESLQRELNPGEDADAARTARARALLRSVTLRP